MNYAFKQFQKQIELLLAKKSKLLTVTALKLPDLSFKQCIFT